MDHFGVQKNQYFWGYEEIVDIFGWSLDRTSNLGVISIHLVFFFLRQGTEWVFLGGHKISNIYLETPHIPDIFIG